MEAIALDEFTRGYVEALLWAESANLPGADEQDDSSFSDNGLGWNDFSDEAQAKIIADCEAFQAENAADLAAGPLKVTNCTPMEYAGHDFWLTRQHHGCGYWDGDWPKDVGERLTKAANDVRGLYPYVGSNGKIYF